MFLTIHRLIESTFNHSSDGLGLFTWINGSCNHDIEVVKLQKKNFEACFTDASRQSTTKGSSEPSFFPTSKAKSKFDNSSSFSESIAGPVVAAGLHKTSLTWHQRERERETYQTELSWLWISDWVETLMKTKDLKPCLGLLCLWQYSRYPVYQPVFFNMKVSSKSRLDISYSAGAPDKFVPPTWQIRPKWTFAFLAKIRNK